MENIRSKIALLVIYNHRYDENISRIERIYSCRFTYLYHVMPFYDGDKSNVLSVYESSYQYQSYVAQAYQQIKRSEAKCVYSHFFVVADDMIINPNINEDNLFEYTGIGVDECYIISVRDISKEKYPMSQFHTISSFNVKIGGEKIPTYDEAIERMRAYGCIEHFAFRWSQLAQHLAHLLISLFGTRKKYQVKMILKVLKMFFLRKKFSYPIVWGGCDCLLLTESVMSTFCTYCGVFAASELFVEFAIPTALILSTRKIITSDDIRLSCIAQLYMVNEAAFCEKYRYSLTSLLEDYPKDVFFIHPIKLSKWIK